MALLIFYWFIPLDSIEFDTQFKGKTFSSNSTDPANMQFYSDMRFPNKEISYKIYNCPLNKKEDMERAIEIVDEETILDFNMVNSGEEISIYCEERAKRDGRHFIAGEGGPTNVTLTGNFNVITHGEISLLKDTLCERPNVAIHELFHYLFIIQKLYKENIS